ncbi:MAG: 3-methyl-2-oxobutanoate hydroxymethyltransferase, partial [Deltaproteobacteria bacterium]|jgi:3-methyl-2-oxobutanoate hydroxymethyltransferase|nr:3-methyl-2-oxobutanoate hydroxymethyltransferase [Deltaproteobacteria bacterium]
LLGLTPDLKPKFVKRYAEFFDEGVAAARRYGDEVRAGSFPDAEHGFGNVKKTETPAQAPGLSLVQEPRSAYGPKG